MNTSLTVRLTRTRRNTPLMLLNGGPFRDTQLTPEQARSLAMTLVGLADAAMEEDMTNRRWRSRVVVLEDIFDDELRERVHAYERQGAAA